MKDIVNKEFEEDFDTLFRHLEGEQHCLTVCDTITLLAILVINLHCVSKKRAPFLFLL